MSAVIKAHDQNEFAMSSWLWKFAFLVCLLVQTGTLGEVDTSHRLQVTRWIWTDAPQSVDPGWSVIGHDGHRYTTAGIGQSLVMLPADVVAHVAELFIQDHRLRERVREGIVALLTFPTLDATGVFLVFQLLGELGFSRLSRLFGALSLLLGSSFLHYCQDHQENSLMTFLGIAGAWGLARWGNTREFKPLIISSLALGFGLLVRPPFLAVSVAIASAFLGGWWCQSRFPQQRDTEGCPRASTPRRSEQFQALGILLAGFVIFVAIDRAYQYRRFGTFTGTYFDAVMAEERIRHPDVADDWLFSGQLAEGFWGPITTPQRSAFVYDPLLFLFPLGFWGRRSRTGIVSWLCVGLGAAFLAQDLFYARYIAWEGAGNWANRHTLTPIQLLVPLAAALAVEAWPRLPRFGRLFVALVTALSLSIQVSSVIFPDALETYTDGVSLKPGGIHFDRPVFLVGKRFANLYDALRGQENPDPVGRQFHRVCLAPAVVAREFPGRGPIAWAAWLLGLLVAGWTVVRLIDAARGNTRTSKTGDGRRVKTC